MQKRILDKFDFEIIERRKIQFKKFSIFPVYFKNNDIYKMYVRGTIRIDNKDIRFLNEVIYKKGNDYVTFINEGFIYKKGNEYKIYFDLEKIKIFNESIDEFSLTINNVHQSFLKINVINNEKFTLNLYINKEYAMSLEFISTKTTCFVIKHASCNSYECIIDFLKDFLNDIEEIKNKEKIIDVLTNYNDEKDVLNNPIYKKARLYGYRFLLFYINEYFKVDLDIPHTLTKLDKTNDKWYLVNSFTIDFYFLLYSSYRIFESTIDGVSLKYSLLNPYMKKAVVGLPLEKAKEKNEILKEVITFKDYVNTVNNNSNSYLNGGEKVNNFYTLAKDEVDIKDFEKAGYKIIHISFKRDRFNSETVSINPYKKILEDVGIKSKKPISYKYFIKLIKESRLLWCKNKKNK